MARLRRSQPSLAGAPELSGYLKLWLLRMMIPLGGHREFIGKHGFRDDAIAEALGLKEWIDVDRDELMGAKFQGVLRRTYREAEQEYKKSGLPRKLRRNIGTLQSLVGLSAADCRILEFVVILHNERVLDDAADWLGQLSSLKIYHVLSVILDLPEKEIQASLSGKGVLCATGLVKLDKDGTNQLRHKLNLLSRGFADAILSSDADPVTLLRDVVVPSRPAELSVADFSHIATSLNVLQSYLRHALLAGRSGVNIFLYGFPGTGKSELSRLLARELDCELFEVASQDNDGDPVDGADRLRAFRAAQSLFANRRALILFDEVEDVFDDGVHYSFSTRERSTAQSRKAWINTMLESNKVPTIWVSNSAACLDQAYIRRFDLVLNLPIPPKRQRERIVQQASQGMLPAETIARIAETENLAPAVVTRAVSVVRCIEEELGKNTVHAVVEQMISNTLEAQGLKGLKRHDSNRLPVTYDPAFIHADADLVAVAKGLGRSKSGRLCLYGPPGTGKTAFGRWLAEQLGVPLLVKKASDLLSMWVGGTEQNIARAFGEAEKEGALLLIDEVDSFLRDRRGATRSWEVTEVNEMLTQMESFPGVFLASTNLITGIDQAAFRRFDLKVKFDFLKSDQAWQLLLRHCAAIAIPAPAPQLKMRLARLACLTPGDFAAVARQNCFRPIETPAAFVHALEQECQVKDITYRQAIGFV